MTYAEYVDTFLMGKRLLGKSNPYNEYSGINI